MICHWHVAPIPEGASRAGLEVVLKKVKKTNDEIEMKGKNLAIMGFVRFLSDFLRLFLLNKTLDIV